MNILTLVCAGMLLSLVLILGVWYIGRRKWDADWQQFANEIGGEFVSRGLQPGLVRAHVGSTLMTMDMHSLPSGETGNTYTRFVAPIGDTTGLWFTIRRSGWTGRVDKSLGLDHFDIGDPEFDRQYTVRGSDEVRVRDLLQDANLRRQLMAQPSMHISAEKGQLQMEVSGAITKLADLKALVRLFETLLGCLEQ